MTDKPQELTMANSPQLDKLKESTDVKDEHEKELSEVYDSGCSDTAKHFLALFEGELTEQMKKWLRLEIAERSKF